MSTNALPADTPQERDLLLNALRAGSIQSRLISTQLDSVNLSLRHRSITCRQALDWLRKDNLLQWVRLGPEGAR